MFSRFVGSMSALNCSYGLLDLALLQGLHAITMFESLSPPPLACGFKCSRVAVAAHNGIPQ